MNTEERLKRLEASAAYRDRQNRRIDEALRSAAGHLVNIPADASLQDIANAIKSAAGQLLAKLKGGDK